MWRTFISALNAVMVLHVLAFIGFAIWLAGTGRLDLARLEEIGRLVELLPEDAKGANGATHVALRNTFASEEGVGLTSAPPSAMAVNDIERQRLREIEQSRRLAKEAADLRRQLLDARESLVEDRAAFEQERAIWEAERARTIEAESDAQFQRVVRLLEDIPARQAKDYLLHLAQRGDAEEAVNYLNAMKPFTASEVMRQFRPEEQQLAADLLQRMKSLREETAAEPIRPPNSDR